MTLREVLTNGKASVGGWCVVPGSFTAEVMARAGFDWICIDTQHGLIGYDQMLTMLQAVAVAGTPSVVRVPWNDPASIMKALDAGAAGVIVPMVNSAAEAAAAVGACRYPPAGYRSWGPTRAALGVADFSPELANRSVICAVMVETVPALDQLAEIVSVPGVDVVFIGPSDFAISMGFAPRSDEAEHRRRLEAVPQICRDHGVIAGIACGSAELLARWSQAGYTMLAAPSEMVLLRQAAAAMLKTVRQ
ncbi:MAG: 2,4-dihydroxyhept-2-ene-1,7-dioic acid aldolase [Chloroflexi bacterium]|nr:MAG: 2,4-dihydroxyhept-2-ene-1,7-dioic acid aldolase [Chloroflexota bacterium]TMC72325.1 MAG: 2,4-dihydroxyhept-2-ene-1,7-dioic acid aldolase [Chloroflexota bacterium]